MARFLQEAAPDGSDIVRVVGEVDLAVVDALKAAVQPSLSNGQAVKMDLSGLEFIDSSGLGALVELHLEARRQGVSLSLTGLRASTHRLLRLTGLDEVFDVPLDSQDSDDGAPS